MAEGNFKIINAKFTHKNIPIHKLEKFQFQDVQAAAEQFKTISDVSECIVIQTASRVEIFLVINLETGDTPDARRPEGKGLVVNQIQEKWIELTELDQYDLDHFDQTLELYSDKQVYHNLLSLACGLDSVVIGKNEILTQLKSAISTAKENKTSGTVLNKLFDTCIRVATQIRETTGIGENVSSLGDIAVKIAEENAGIDKKKHILLIGTGTSAARVAKALNRKGYAFDVVSLTIDRATGFSKILGGTPIEWKDVFPGFDKFDIVFVATTADYFLIQPEHIKRVVENKKSGILILDVSDPRAVADKVSIIPKVKLMSRDQILELVEENETIRMNKVPDVEKLIAKEVPVIEATMKRVNAEPIVGEVLETVDTIRKQELEKALEQLGDLDENKKKIIEELTKSVAQSIVSVPKKTEEKSE
ncbi:MAG: glutamyl-tRNA reductase [Nitrososphaeria archaeon]|nr:glutamyl-tRNA reductase [Nitrosopumilaceae archaeon]NIP10019.1 glutamyl-tRNA reductase [Nitrosopumilaceae archaeon]NIP90996.1 glutamyl-tRNA reductase [Nitrososphaeria archaeon]NIS94815.1 glutamyl-tRNA reductase [Nitrosopumilaceae archaeon]